MRILFDARHIAAQYTGLGRYTASLLQALLETYTRPGLELEVLLHDGVDWSGNFHHASIAGFAARGRCVISRAPAAPISLRQQWSMARWVNARGGDAYFYPHFDPPLGVRMPMTFVVHDLLPLVVRDYVQRLAWAKRLYFAQIIRAAVRRARHCFTVSRTTREDVLGLVGDRFAAKVSYAYEAPVLAPVDARAAGLPAGVTRPYLFYVGDRRPHKNLPRIIGLFRLLRERHGYPGTLVIAGSTRNYGTDVDALIGQSADIRVLGNVSDTELGALYAGTDALVFLSEYEGFGLPVVEAARYDRPMILSDGGSLAEIAPADACVLPRTLGLEAAAARAAAYLRPGRALDHSAYLAGFSWEHTARVLFPDAYA